MPEEQQQQSEEMAAPTEPDFDWEKFFLDEAGPPPAAQAPSPQAQSAPPDDEDGEDDEDDVTPEVKNLRQEVESLKSQIAEAGKVTGEIVQQNKLNTAIDAWKKQATPAELEMADMLAEAKTVDELKVTAAAIKRATTGLDKFMARESERIRREVNREAGLPVPQQFTPIPDKEKYNEAVEAGDIEKAASLAVKDMF